MKDMTDVQHKEQKRSNILNYIAFGVLGLVLLGLVQFTVWALADTNVIEVRNVPLPVRTIRDEAHPEGVVILLVDYCKNLSVHGRSRVSFVSSTREILLPSPRLTEKNERAEVGCNFGQDKPTEFPILIPKDIPPDTYKVHFRVTYDVNPLKRNVIEEFESQEFVVAE